METYRRVERRKHRRYIVRGRVKFTIDSLHLWADLVNFGPEGMLIRCRYEIPEKTQLEFHVIAYCYPTTFEVHGLVVGGRDSLLAIQFLDGTDAASELLQWLEDENFPWTGSMPGNSVEQLKSGPLPVRESVGRLSEAEAESSLEFIFQEA